MIETDRLVIKRFSLKNIDAFKDIVKDFNNSKYVVYDRPFPKSDKELENLAQKFSENKLFFEVDLKENSKMIGYICFNVNQNDYDIGYCFHSKFSKKGFGFESCKATMNWLKHHYKVHKFTAGTALENIPSYNLLIKLGFQIINTEALSFQKDKNGNNIEFTGGNFELLV